MQGFSLVSWLERIIFHSGLDMNRRTVFLILSFFLLRVGIHLPGFSEEPAAAPIPAVGQPNQYGTCTKRALDWLKQNQNADGSWGDSHKAAMT